VILLITRRSFRDHDGVNCATVSLMRLRYARR
jgi:hypothetical protein